MTKTLLTTALLVASFATVSLAKTEVSGGLQAGWDNYYSNNSLILSSGIVDDGVSYAGANLRVSNEGQPDIVASFTSRNISTYGQDSLIKDQSTLYVGLEGENYGWTTSFGYQMIKGGLPGAVADLHKLIDGKTSDKDMDHMLKFESLYQFGDTGWYVGGSVAYSVYGTEGWQMSVMGGYAYKVHEKVTLIAQADVAFSQKYLVGLDNKDRVEDYSGTDGYSLTLCAKIQATEAVTITPYVSCVWAGHNPIAMNKGWAVGSNIFRNYATMAGISATWSF